MDLALDKNDTIIKKNGWFLNKNQKSGRLCEGSSKKLYSYWLHQRVSRSISSLLKVLLEHVHTCFKDLLNNLSNNQHKEWAH